MVDSHPRPRPLQAGSTRRYRTQVAYLVHHHTLPVEILKLPALTVVLIFRTGLLALPPLVVAEAVALVERVALMPRSGKHAKCDVWRGTAADLATAAAYIAARCAQLPLTLMHTAEVGGVSSTCTSLHAQATIDLHRRCCGLFRHVKLQQAARATTEQHSSACLKHVPCCADEGALTGQCGAALGAHPGDDAPCRASRSGAEIHVATRLPQPAGAPLPPPAPNLRRSTCSDAPGTMSRCAQLTVVAEHQQALTESG